MPCVVSRLNHSRLAAALAGAGLCLLVGLCLLAGLYLLVGLGGGVALAAPDAPPDGAAADARAAVLAQAFGAPCGESLPPSPVALVAPLDGLYTKFQQARCLAAAGKLAEAAQGFRAGLEVPLAVPTLWRWERVQALVLSSEHEAALRELEGLLTSNPDPLLIDRVRTLMTALVLQPGSAPRERQTNYLVTYLEHVTPQSDDYDLLLRLWELTDQPERKLLRAAVAVLLWRNPKDEDAAARWAPLPASAMTPDAFPATAADYYGRAERLFSLGLFEELAAELETPTLPKLEPVYAKALGRLYFRALIRGELLQRAAVQVNTDSVIERFAFDRRQQLVWAIRVQLKRRKIGAVLKYLAELEALSPKDEDLPTFYLELLKYNQGQHDAVTMNFWLDRLTQTFPAAQETSDGYWQVIWDRIEHEDYETAQPLLTKAIEHGAAFHPVDQARLYYWSGRLQMLQGDETAGAATWHDLEERFPYGYYTVMAQWKQSGQKLVLTNGLTEADGSPPHPLPAPEIQELWSVPPFPQALFLFSVGENDLGTALLRDVVGQRLSPKALEEAGALFFYLDRHYLQLRLLANHALDEMRRSRPDDTPLWHRAFPRPHWDVVRRLAVEQQIDPYFVFAIMREESRFFSSAYSRAGAKGLMQIMPDTARMMAKRNGLAYDEDRLHMPSLNIPLGVLYLKRVLQRFDGNPFYAAAAYNAGPGNAQRWVKRYGDLPLDEFVERIPFGETQRYVKRVILSYLVYRKLYR